MGCFFRSVFSVVVACVAAVLVMGVVYSFVPPVSMLMLGRWAFWREVAQQPVPLEHISPHLIRAVIRAEDSRFCTHHGIDWQSMRQAVESAGERKVPRGASTISMQVAKNLFLWPQHSYLRKALEVPVALYLDALWPKRRMLEVYLSIAEWGTGVFGVEAAARRYFGKPASALNAREAALMAAALPNPLMRHPNRPNAGYRRYAQVIQQGARQGVDISCILR